MAVGIPLPTNYTDGDVWSASDVNDITGTINTLGGGNFAAGKNKIINGDFYFNERNFTSTTTSGTYGFDRWTTYMFDGTSTYSSQNFTPGTAPVAGYEGKSYLRMVTTGQTNSIAATIIKQRIEDVRTFAGQTVTLSFWAKAASGTPKIYAELVQNFGSGGSGDVNITGTQLTLSTSWARYTYTVAVPSISGKTIGTSSLLDLNLWVSAGSGYNARTNSLGIQSNTFDIWGVQVEAGSTATAFQTASGTIGGELALCQRYYYVHASGATLAIGVGYNETGSSMGTHVKYGVTMRTGASLVVATGTDYYTFYRNGSNDNFNSFTQGASGSREAAIYNNSEISGNAGDAGNCYTNNAAAMVAFNAEL